MASGAKGDGGRDRLPAAKFPENVQRSSSSQKYVGTCSKLRVLEAHPLAAGAGLLLASSLASLAPLAASEATPATSLAASLPTLLARGALTLLARGALPLPRDGCHGLLCLLQLLLMSAHCCHWLRAMAQPQAVSLLRELPQVPHLSAGQVDLKRRR